MAMENPEPIKVRFVKKMSALFRAASENIHTTGTYREHIGKGKQYRYCFVGLIQCKGGHFQHDDSNGKKPYIAEHEAFMKFVPTDMRGTFDETRYKCPAIFDKEKCGYGDAETLDMRTMLIHLNDNHNWTFEQGATWLESVGL